MVAESGKWERWVKWEKSKKSENLWKWEEEKEAKEVKQADKGRKAAKAANARLSGAASDGKSRLVGFGGEYSNSAPIVQLHISPANTPNNGRWEDSQLFSEELLFPLTSRQGP
jgi:hypothetical protein